MARGSSRIAPRDDLADRQEGGRFAVEQRTKLPVQLCVEFEIVGTRWLCFADELDEAILVHRS
jgi:hypothetical protein